MIRRPRPTADGTFLSHVLRNFIEDVGIGGDFQRGVDIPEPCAQELH